MNFKMVLKSLGIILVCEACLMLPSAAISLYSGDSSAQAFSLSILLMLIPGLAAVFVKPANRNIYARDGFAIVAFGWIIVSFFGALPLYFSGAVPSLIDGFFEAASGFTTTGASILTDIEVLPKGILFWRSFTHWAGGMGVLVLTLALFPAVGAGAQHILKAESPGPSPDKLVPKLAQTAKILYIIYSIMTLAQVLLLVAAGMSLYDALIHAFGTAGTGGFSNMNASVGSFKNVWVDVIITVFMLLFGVNFSLYYKVLKGNISEVLQDEELKLYFGIVACSIALITLNIFGTIYKSMWEALRYSAFQVASIITTTGFATADFNQWPIFSKAILVLLMFIGASAGSTGGAIKVVRVLLLFKLVKRELVKIIHPRSVHTVKFGGKAVNEEILTGIMSFFFLYIFVFVASVLIVALDGKGLETTFTAVAATLGNIGPGLAEVGPVGNYSTFSDLSKFVLSFCMIIGRLELYPVLLLLVPSFWKRVNI